MTADQSALASPTRADTADDRRHRASAKYGLSLRAGELGALRMWLLTRVAVFLTVAASTWINADASEVHKTASFFSRWFRFDTKLYIDIARQGYGVGDRHNDAFFPGFPLALRLGHRLTGVNEVWIGLAISLVATAVAAVGIARLVYLEFPESKAQQIAERAVLFLFLAPSAVFLTAAYSEPMFLAFSVLGWLAARRGSWWWAGILAAGATATRPSGLFLLGGLIIEFLTSDKRRWRAAPGVLLAAVPPAAYLIYLHNATGDWLDWRHAEERGWGRYPAWPWSSLWTNLSWVFGSGNWSTTQRAEYALEVASLVVGVILTVYLLRSRKWGEATYIGLTTLAFSTSSLYQSGARGTLLWWPLWIWLAQAGIRRPMISQLYLVVCAPLMITYVIAFTHGAWSG